ncbi:hypothetical protein E4T56_gene12775 [Termitomyces sp. T112]|nr:hypothetical protein E4T56_gene12775 [Termitomyces sp. T112]
MVPPLPVYGRVNRLGPVNQPTVAQVTMDIPETHLLEGWDAPLQNPLPRLVPPLPAPIHGRVIKAPLPQPMLIMIPPPPHTLALFQEQQRLKQRQQEQALAALQEQQRLRHIALAEEQKRQQEKALAVLQEQQRDDMPSEDDLEYVDPVGHQLAEQLNPPLDDPLGPHDDMPSKDDLEYVDPVQQRPAEDLDPALPNHPAGL